MESQNRTHRETTVYERNHEPPAPAVLGIGGSPRKGGNSDILLRHILKGAAETGRETTAVLLREYRFESCIGCEKCRQTGECIGLNDGMRLLYPAIHRCRGLVLVSPTHTYNVTAWMKAFIDRLYCFYQFGTDRPRSWKSRLAGQERRAVTATICEQESEENMGVTTRAMRLPLESHDYRIVREMKVFRLFDRGIIKDHPDLLAEAQDAGRALAAAL